MSTFEKKLARFREEQKKGTTMKQHRTKLIKQLEEQMEKTNDPQLKLDLAKQITKLMPRPRQRKAKTKEVVVPSRSGASPLVAKWADRLAHVQPERKRIEQALICEVEERRKKPGCAQVRTVLEEVMGSLSAEERGVLNGGSAEVA